MVECPAKHTKYQPTEAEISCPKCHAPCGVFCIGENAPNEADGCERMHIEEVYECMKCSYTISGQQFAAQAMRKAKRKPCPHCNGTGHVAA